MKKATDDVVWVDKIPPYRSTTGKWMTKLGMLVEKRGRLALIETFDTPTQARDAQNNLSQRKVNIPHPDHEWFFGARGSELYAKYVGPYPKTSTAKKRSK